MKFKKIFAAAAACAVATLSAASYAATTVSAATVVGKAMLSGQMGTYSQWKEEDAIANGSTVANIDGNAQYEATWNPLLPAPFCQKPSDKFQCYFPFGQPYGP